MDAQMIINILVQTSYAATPLLLASVGEIVGERAGIVNIGLEGIMLISGFVSIVLAYTFQSPFIGVIGGILIGGVIGLLHAIIATYLKGDHVISGIGINLFAAGFVPYGIEAVWGVRGYFTIPASLKVPKIPGTDLSPLFITSIALALITYLVMFKTPYGLMLRACGEEPRAAESAGIRIEMTQTLASIITGLFTGLAGAFLAIDWLSSITKNLPAGRGFIALAIVNFANWNPILGVAGSYLFGFFWVLIGWLKLSPLKEIIPLPLMETFPYIATLAVTAGVIGRARPPRFVGKTYKRE
ncbi:MAG: ABC transporter permease [Thermosphaera sp.]